jgi:hypothetical protein
MNLSTIASGGYQSMSITEDGIVYIHDRMGYDIYDNEYMKQGKNEKIISVNQSTYHSLGITENGNIVNFYPPRDPGRALVVPGYIVPPKGTRFIQICKNNNSCMSYGLLDDGRVKELCRLLYKDFRPPMEIIKNNKIIYIDFEDNNKYAVLENGEIIDITIDITIGKDITYKLINPPKGTKFIQVSTNSYYEKTIALLDNGNIVFLKKDKDTGECTISDQINLGNNVVQVFVNLRSYFCLLDNGYIYANLDRFVDPSKKSCTIRPPKGTKFIQINSGEGDLIGLLDNGQIVFYGEGHRGLDPRMSDPPDGHIYVNNVLNGTYTKSANKK